jgi:hypothetical protein
MFMREPWVSVPVDQPGAAPLETLNRALQRADRGPALAGDLSVLRAIRLAVVIERRTAPVLVIERPTASIGIGQAHAAA